MFDDHIINGGRKVPHTPNLAAYDRKKPPASMAADPAFISQFFNWNGILDKDAPRTHARDKAELVAFGVNGEVPLAQARVNAEDRVAWKVGDQWVVQTECGYLRNGHPANDNTKSAAKAA